MRVKCLFNTGAGFSERTMARTGDSAEARLPMCVNDIYTVYGQMISRGVLKYLIKGANENLPSWYPAEIFEVVDPLLPLEWYFRYDRDEDISAVWGFWELVNDRPYLEDLIEREDYAIRIFLKRKKEIDEFTE